MNDKIDSNVISENISKIYGKSLLLLFKNFESKTKIKILSVYK